MFSFLGLLTGLFFCCLVTSVEWVEYRGLWYYISDGEGVVYIEATAKCDSMNAHLAVITTDDQNHFLRDETTDGINRWIGLSNQESYHNAGPCKNKTLFWNSDWNCTNDFNPNAYLLTQPLSECVGVTTRSGMWRVKHCSVESGFICQWECKSFYLDLKFDDGNLTGIYEFSDYFDKHAVYSKSGTNSRLRIYKFDSINQWSIHDDDTRGYFRAKSISGLYVPYDRDLVWTTVKGGLITSSTICMECKALYLCISPPKPKITRPCFDIFLNHTTPEYFNTKEEVYLKPYINSQLCFCTPTRDMCGNNCGYIFPYPNAASNLVIGGNTLTLTHKCIYKNHTIGSGIDSQMTTLALNITDEVDNSTVIVASTVPVAITIIVLMVVVIVIVLRKKRNENKATKSHMQTPCIGNTIDNVYFENDDSKVASTLEPAFTESPTDSSHSRNENGTEGHYTYIDRASKENSDNNDESIYSKEKPMGGYLASDNGTLMDDQTKQDQLDSNQHTHDPPMYAEVKRTKCHREGSKQGNETPKDLQIDDNGTRHSDPENAYNISGQFGDNMSATDCNYYNTERKDYGDDDLELFENTVYNQM